MIYTIFILLIGISFSPLIFPKMHPWLAQGMWTQCCIAIMFFFSLFENRRRTIKNCPIALLFIWVTFLSALVCYRAQNNNSHQFFYILQYFNFLCIIIFYKLLHEYLRYEHIVNLLKWMKYVVLITLGISVLQIFNISQFFGLIEKNDIYHDNIVTGFIGNGTHLSGFLSICLPLFLVERRRQDALSIILLFLVLCFCGTSKNDVSASGFVVSAIVFLNFYKTSKIIKYGFPFLFFLFLIPYPERFFYFNGRIETWGQCLKFFIQRPITGQGLGATDVLFRNGYINTPHLHFEYLQYLFELGIIGILLITNIIKDCFDRIATSRLQLALKSSLLAFLCVCGLLFPTHLWLEGVWGMFFYVAFLIVNKEESKWQVEKKSEMK